MSNKVAIVSGGMDSVVMLKRFAPSLACVMYFNYGSNHAQKESYFSRLHAEEHKLAWLEIDLGFIKQHFSSALLQGSEAIPDGHYQDEIMKKTVVPFRNGIMLSIAAGFAESIGASAVMIGSHFGDHAIYPDCRADFITPMRAAVKAGTYANIEVEAPFASFVKRDIGMLGKQLGVDFTQSWSCYKNGEHHCGTCGTCVERKEALQGFDPTYYEVL
ncbi:MAG: 7-cyano-7-deazaguanine synthase [Hyphomicrobiaceae bacterium]|nr:MAG: 7-cyano-7-deazaguanine synthase [Hyphomicrobiaceae bacterium]